MQPQGGEQGVGLREEGAGRGGGGLTGALGHQKLGPAMSGRSACKRKVTWLREEQIRKKINHRRAAALSTVFFSDFN